MTIAIEQLADGHIPGYNACVDEVASERRYLSMTVGPELEQSRAWVSRIRSLGLPIFVAVDDGQVVGWCDISPLDWPVHQHIGTLGIGLLEGYRGRGIGAQLLTATLAAARERGLERIELGVYKSNRRAQALYRRFGFAVEGVKRKGRKLDGIYEDIVIMALLFEGPR